ncbi:hydrolase [Horticoccus sp. 23ND18S-11]|uniref:hydrolase n=1 Tax=Horticoccus sp. 23ND18S-11 TaxID=3391832 RepID=UPI0039C8CA7D
MNLPSAIARLPERTPEFGALLVRWAEINSGSGHLAGLNRMRDALREEFGKFNGATVEELPCPGTAAALRVSVRPEAKTRILLNGHFDTVYEANDAFQRCQWLDPERLNGPGVADMKGGLLTILAALQAFEATPHAAAIGWDVLLTPDEETGSHGSRALFLAAPARVQFGLVFEPGRPSGDIVHSRKGTGGMIVTARGRASHAAKVPNDGRNAILALADFLLAANKIPGELPGVLLNVGNIRGGGPATNVVPDFAEAELDLRITKVSDREPLLARLQAIADEINTREGFKLELKGWFNRPPKECLPLEAKVFPEWQRAAHDVGVAPPNWVHTGGASDGNFLTAAGLPNLDGVGPVGDHLHSSREFLLVPTVAKRAQIVALFLHRVAAGEIVLAT